jgi:hypothetical protein
VFSGRRAICMTRYRSFDTDGAGEEDVCCSEFVKRNGKDAERR